MIAGNYRQKLHGDTLCSIRYNIDVSSRSVAIGSAEYGCYPRVNRDQYMQAVTLFAIADTESEFLHNFTPLCPQVYTI
jgi:hypothetical protein